MSACAGPWRIAALLICIVCAIVQLLAASPQGQREPRGPVTGVAVPRANAQRGQAVPRDRDRWHPSTEYFLVAPIGWKSTYLLDDHLRVVHSWESEYTPGLSAYLLDDGGLLRAASVGGDAFPGGNGGRIELFASSGALRWSVEYATTRVQQHHDAILLPNGHVLMVAWEKRTIAEALDAGRRVETLPGGPEIWSDTLVEMDPQQGALTWVWRAWDHLVPPGEPPASYPRLIDPNYAATPDPDWTHANAVAYNADLDQVVVSVRNHSEIWVIDHGTTSQEASGHRGGRRGHGGDLLYRWGNPAAYGAAGPQQLFYQHNAQWIPTGLSGEGNILIFNNGDRSTRPWSSAIEILTPLRHDGLYESDSGGGFGHGESRWEYTADPPESLFGAYASGVQRLASGNTLIAVTEAGRFREVDPQGRLVVEYQLEANGEPLHPFRVLSYSPTSAAFAALPLTRIGATLGRVLYRD